MDTGKVVFNPDEIEIKDSKGQVRVKMGIMEGSMEKRYLIVQELNLVQPTTMQNTYMDAKAIYDAHQDLNIWFLMHTPGVEHFWRLFNKNYVQLSFNGEVPWLGSDSTKEVEMFAILRGLL